MYAQDNILCQFGLFRHKFTTVPPPILNHFWWELYQLLKGNEALLNRTNMMALCHDQQIDTGLLHKAIANQVSQQQTHSHMETCKKGMLGHTGCHLSMPFGSLSTTSHVVLKPTNTDGETNDYYTEVSSNVQQRTISETLKYGIHNPGMYNILPQVELLPLTDIRNWKTDIAVVWETCRPCHQEQTLTSVPQSTSNEVEQSKNIMFRGEENREIVVMLDQWHTIDQLHQILDDIPGFDSCRILGITALNSLLQYITWLVWQVCSVNGMVQNKKA